MTNIRYIILFALVVVAAVAGVLIQEEDDSPAITFTRPDVVETDLPGDEQKMQGAEALIVPLTEPLTPAPEQVANSSDGGMSHPVEESLTDEQLQRQIELAQAKLAQVESLNERKQALIKKTISQQDDAEQSLIEAELAYRIGGWKQAWRAGDAHTYFGFYSDKFTPSNGKTVDEWKQQRVKRLNTEQSIDLILEDFEVKYDPQSQRSLVTFRQFYKSGTFQDSTKKRLILANEDGQWRIVSETTQ